MLSAAWHPSDFVPTPNELNSDLDLQHLPNWCLWNANDLQDAQHDPPHHIHPLESLLHAVAHVASLCRTHASLFPPTGFHNVSAFLNQLHFFLHALFAFYDQASSCTSWL